MILSYLNEMETLFLIHKIMIKHYMNKTPCFLRLCLCCPQISVEAPWLSDIQASCAVVGQGILTCVDSATVSLYMLGLHEESQMTQIPLQVPTEI